MRCTRCHGGTILLPAKPGHLAALALCPECRGRGVRVPDHQRPTDLLVRLVVRLGSVVREAAKPA